MTNQIRIIIALLIFGSLSAFSLAASAAEPPQMKTVKANTLTNFEFKGGDSYTDAILKLKLLADCTVTVTRVETKAADVKKRCDGNPWLRHSKPVYEKPAKGGTDKRAQVSYYKIEGTCPDNAFPAYIEISYFGNAPKARGTEAFQTRLIHDNGTSCEDITYEIDDSADPSSDPKGSGGEGGFSDFFLVNLRDVSLPNSNRVDIRLHRLQQAIPSTAPNTVFTDSQTAHFAFDSGVDYLQQGDLNKATEQLELAKTTLDQFVTDVQSATSTQITRHDANGLVVHATALKFTIDQFMDLNDL